MRATVLGSLALVVSVAVVAIGTRPGCTAARALAPAPLSLGPVQGFVANHGQWPASVAFAACAAGEWMHVGDDRIVFGRGERRAAMRWRGAALHAVRGRDATGGVCNFLLGADPSRHVLAVPVFAAVERLGIADGVDLVLRRAAPGRGAAFAYDLHLREGARLADVEFAIDGASSLSIDAASGDLVLDVGGAQLRQTGPIAWRDADGRREPVACRFERRGPATFGFRVDGGAPPAALCIDPDLRWGSCLGGTAIEFGNGVATAANGDVFVAGTTQSTTLPATAGAFDPSWNGGTTVPGFVGDGWVARFAAANGALLWCTYVGGGENDQIEVLRSVGNDAVITGWTSSTDYPTTTGAFDTTHNGTGDGYVYGGGDIMVTRLAAHGQSLVWSSFLGGSMLEYAVSLAIAPNGEVAVAGHVHSPNFPVTPGCFRSTMLGFSDLYVAHFSADGATLLGSTYCGGSDGEEYPYALAFAANGDLIAGGGTDSTDLPITAGVWDPTFNGGTAHLADGFVLCVDGSCSQLRWCTYLGTPANEHVRGIAVHGDGAITLTGNIDGPGLPTTPQSFGPAPAGLLDGFAWRLSANGGSTLWATYVGGSADDELKGAVDVGGGRTAIAGTSSSPNVPTSRGSAFPSFPGGASGWLVVLGSDGQTLDYGTTVGVLGAFGTDVARAPDGDLVTAGTNFSGTFPVTAGGNPYVAGGDGYALRVAGLPQGVERVGAPSGACVRGARIMARSGPFVGESTFALTAGDVPAGSPALAAVSTAALTAPLPILGIDVWVDPTGLIATPSIAVDGHGCARLPIPVPNNAALVGTTLAAQFVWLDACPGLSFGASDAARVVIQP